MTRNTYERNEYLLSGCVSEVASCLSDYFERQVGSEHYGALLCDHFLVDLGHENTISDTLVELIPEWIELEEDDRAWSRGVDRCFDRYLDAVDALIKVHTEDCRKYFRQGCWIIGGDLDALGVQNPESGVPCQCNVIVELAVFLASAGLEWKDGDMTYDASNLHEWVVRWIQHNHRETFWKQASRVAPYLLTQECLDACQAASSASPVICSNGRFLNVGECTHSWLDQIEELGYRLRFFGILDPNEENSFSEIVVLNRTHRRGVLSYADLQSVMILIEPWNAASWPGIRPLLAFHYWKRHCLPSCSNIRGRIVQAVSQKTAEIRSQKEFLQERERRMELGEYRSIPGPGGKAPDEIPDPHAELIAALC